MKIIPSWPYFVTNLKTFNSLANDWLLFNALALDFMILPINCLKEADVRTLPRCWDIPSSKFRISDNRFPHLPAPNPRRIPAINEKVINLGNQKSGMQPAVHEVEEDEIVCRVCRSPGELPDNPLFYPCRCKGSIKYVHNDCLTMWLVRIEILNCYLIF